MWTSCTTDQSNQPSSLRTGWGATYDAPHAVLVKRIPADAHDHWVHVPLPLPLLVVLVACAEQRAADGAGYFAARLLDLVG